VAKQTITSVVRAILSENINLSADEVVAKAKARGLKAPDKSIRNLTHNIKSDMRRGRVKPLPVAAPAATAAHQAPAPKPAATKPAPTPKAAPAAPKSPTADLTGVFANVALVNKVVGVAGGVDQARQVAEAVRACGGVDAFLQHLDLVGGIRTAGPA
jgi:hypothetical protein